MLAALDAELDDEGDKDPFSRLHLRHFGESPSTVKGGRRPSVSRFMGKAGSPHSITLVNACGTEAGDILDQLMPNCTQVVLVERPDGGDDWPDAEDIFGDKMLGRIFVGEGS